MIIQTLLSKLENSLAIHRPPPLPLTRDEAQLKKLFSELDTDGNGSITPDEFKVLPMFSSAVCICVCMTHRDSHTMTHDHMTA